MFRYIIVFIFVFFAIHVNCQINSIGLDTRFNTYKNSLLKKRGGTNDRIFSYKGNSLSFGLSNNSAIAIGMYIYNNSTTTKFVEREIYLEYQFQPLKTIHHQEKTSSNILLAIRVFNLLERYNPHANFIYPIIIRNNGLIPMLNYKFQYQINRKINICATINLIGLSFSYQTTIEENVNLIARNNRLEQGIDVDLGFGNEMLIGLDYSF